MEPWGWQQPTLVLPQSPPWRKGWGGPLQQGPVSPALSHAFCSLNSQTDLPLSAPCVPRRHILYFLFQLFSIVTFKRGFDIFLLLPSGREGANNSVDMGVCSPCDSSFSNHYLLHEQKNGLLTRLALRVSAEGTAFRCWVCGAQSCFHGRQTDSGPGQPYSAPAVLSQGSGSLLFE